MKCPVCGNEMHMEKTMVRRTVNGKSVVFKSVPALVCTNDYCGQKALYPDTAHKIQDVISKAKSEDHPLNPIFDFDEADQYLSSNLETV